MAAPKKLTFLVTKCFLVCKYGIGLPGSISSKPSDCLSDVVEAAEDNSIVCVIESRTLLRVDEAVVSI
jgi:hypothetical protein